VVVKGEDELVQLASAQLAQLQRVECLHVVEAGLVQLAGPSLCSSGLMRGCRGVVGGAIVSWSSCDFFDLFSCG
jgi:hypothetical protein